MKKESICAAYASWREKKIGLVSFEDPMKSGITFSVPPEFMGHQHIITPEDLFLSSVLTCLASYFFNMAAKSMLKFVSYDSCAKSRLIEVGHDYVFSDIIIYATVKVAGDKDVHKAERAMEIAKKGCYVANSIKTNVIINTNIEIVKK